AAHLTTTLQQQQPSQPPSYNSIVPNAQGQNATTSTASGGGLIAGNNRQATTACRSPAIDTPTHLRGVAAAAAAAANRPSPTLASRVTTPKDANPSAAAQGQVFFGADFSLTVQAPNEPKKGQVPQGNAHT